MKRIAIFASGAGSNTAKIIDYFTTNEKKVTIALIVCNKPTAKVLLIAQENNIPSLLIDKEKFFNTDIYLNQLLNSKIDLIVLAGFLWKMPANFVQAFPNKIINLHPALLPKYGGKGMYGHHVHEAVIANKEKESGITIHFVNEKYDEGEPIFKASCTIDTTETAESLAKKIQVLEHEHFAKTIEKVLKSM
jgi:phosphoribosylglycinamide formyltransferase-1